MTIGMIITKIVLEDVGVWVLMSGLAMVIVSLVVFGITHHHC